MGLKNLARPAYAVALALILFPLLDVGVSVFPFRIGEPSWRFAAAGVLSRSLVIPLLGVLLASILTVLVRSKPIRHAIAALRVLGLICMIGIVGVFLLDALQLRSQVPPRAVPGFDLATGLAVVKYCVAITIVFAIARASRSARQLARPGDDEGSRQRLGLVFSPHR